MTKEAIIPIIEKAVHGDNSAFEAIYRTYWNMAYFYCFKYLKSKSEAEEVAQDAFFALYRNISNLNDPKLFVAYFSRILFNTCYNRSKNRKNINNTMSFSVDDYTETLPEERMDFLPEATMNHMEFKDEISQLIDELPNKQREVMLLHYLNELTQSEIAAVLDVKPSVVGNRLFHAKASLKKKLEKRNLKSPALTSIAPIPLAPLITQALRDEMASIATPDIESRMWDGLQNKIGEYKAGKTPASYTPPSSLANVGIIVAACAAIVCFGAFGINYYNSICRADRYERTEAVAIQMDASSILDELRSITTLDGFNEFATYHGFNAEQVVTWYTQAGEVQYYLYHRAFYDMAIFVGVKNGSRGVSIVYETALPGTMPPQDVVAWINAKIG